MHWLPDPSSASVRHAVTAVLPALTDARIEVSPQLETMSNPEWCVSTAIVDGSFLVKFAWSAVGAARVQREAKVLAVVARAAPDLPVPRVEGSSEDPVAFATRLVAGEPLRLDDVRVTAQDRESIAHQVVSFLADLHRPVVLEEIRLHVPVVVGPQPQATTRSLREQLPRFLDSRRAGLVFVWCDWVDEVLGTSAPPPVFVHGDLHGFNQVWDRTAWKLRLVADFEVAGPADAEYDLRYFPPLEPTLALVHAIQNRYASLNGRVIDMSRVMAWYIRTALGDALWRSEAGVALPFGNTPASYVDDIERKMRLSGVYA